MSKHGEKMTQEHYIYIYLDPRKPGLYTYDNLTFDYEPIYIGKGKHDRDSYHFKYCCVNEILKRKLDKIKKLNLIPIINRIFENLEDVESQRLEIELIKKIGRLNKNTGPLCNMTDGGEGCSGLIQTNEHRQKNREKNSQNYEKRYGAETAQRLRKMRSEQLKGNSYGKNISKEGKEKISKAAKRPWSEKYSEDSIKKRITCYYVKSPDSSEYIIFGINDLIAFSIEQHELSKTSLWSSTWKNSKTPNFYKNWCCKIIGNQYEFDNNLISMYNNIKVWRKNETYN